MKSLTNLKFCWLIFINTLLVLDINANSPNYKIVIGLKNTPSDTAYLAHYYSNNLVIVDTSVSNANSQFIFIGNHLLKQGLYNVICGNQKLDLIVDSQNFTIDTDLENPINAEINNSKENTIYFSYKSYILKSKQVKDSLLKLYPDQNNNPDFKIKMKDLSSKVSEFKRNFFRQYSHSFAAKIISANNILVKPNNKSIDKDIRSKIFKEIDLNDSRMLLTPYIEEGILKYLNLTPFNPDSLVKNCDQLFALSRLNLEVNNYVISYLINKFDAENKPWFDVLYIHLNSKYVIKTLDIKSDSLSIIKSKIKRKKALLTGTIAPEINFLDTTGKRISLHAVKAKYVALYFWDPDCEHCKLTTPLLKELYSKYDPKDFQVYAVSTQQQYKSWTKYISSNNLNWINVWEPELIEKTYIQYQIGTTPQIFLLDPEKRFTCKNISLTELKNYLTILGVKENK